MAVLCLILLILLNFYLKRSASDKTLTKLNNTIATNQLHLSQEMMNADKLLLEIPYYSADFLEIVQADSADADRVGSIVRMQRLLKGIKPGIGCVDGLFLYFSGDDSYLSAAENQEKEYLSMELRNVLRERIRNGETVQELMTDGWEFLFLKGEPCVIKITTQTNGALTGAFAHMDTIMERRMMSVHEGYIYYLLNDNNDLIYQSAALPYPFLENKGKLPEEGELSEIICDGEQYCAYQAATDYDGIRLVCLFPVSDEAIDMKPIWFLSAVILSVFFLFTGIIWILFQRLLIRPFVEMEEVNRQIAQEEGVPDLTFPTVKCREIDRSLRTVEYLCHISLEMQKNYYMEKQTRTKAELDKFKSQVAPHFLVNCLYALQNLADSGHAESEIFSSLIGTLSEHLRYSLSDREKVSLREELYYVENYLKLTQIRFPLCLDYEITAEEDAKHATIFTLMLLMFTENAVKYNLVMGSKLTVTVACELAKEEDATYLVVTHCDSGKGYPEEILEKLNRREPVQDHRGNHIGLLNVIKRLELMYPDSSIRFYNDPGACVELRMPYLRMEDDAYDEFADCG